MSNRKPVYLTGDKNVDRLVLDKITDDAELLEICQTNKDIYERVCDETFFRNRVVSKYPETIKYKDYVKTRKPRTWKNHFLSIVTYIDKLKTEYNYEYKGNGSPELEYLLRQILPHPLYDYGIKDKLLYAINNGNFPIVKYLTETVNRITNYDKSLALGWAAEDGYLSIVEYLVQQGADIHNEKDYALRLAIENRHFSVVKYLVENKANVNVNANVNAYGSAPLLTAISNNDLPMVEYLVRHGADVHFHNDYALKEATRLGYADIANSLADTN